MALIDVQGDKRRCDGCKGIVGDWYERNGSDYCWSCMFSALEAEGIITRKPKPSAEVGAPDPWGTLIPN